MKTSQSKLFARYNPNIKAIEFNTHYSQPGVFHYKHRERTSSQHLCMQRTRSDKVYQCRWPWREHRGLRGKDQRRVQRRIHGNRMSRASISYRVGSGSPTSNQKPIQTRLTRNRATNKQQESKDKEYWSYRTKDITHAQEDWSRNRLD